MTLLMHCDCCCFIFSWIWHLVILSLSLLFGVVEPFVTKTGNLFKRLYFLHFSWRRNNNYRRRFNRLGNQKQERSLVLVSLRPIYSVYSVQLLVDRLQHCRQREETKGQRNSKDAFRAIAQEWYLFFPFIFFSSNRITSTTKKNSSRRGKTVNTIVEELVGFQCPLNIDVFEGQYILFIRMWA